MRRWTKKVDVFARDYIFVPLHQVGCSQLPHEFLSVDLSRVNSAQLSPFHLLTGLPLGAGRGQPAREEVSVLRFNEWAAGQMAQGEFWAIPAGCCFTSRANLG